MDFVIDVLIRFFGMNLDKATQVMLHVHTRGRGVCGVFTREVAESKVAQVNAYSRLNQHPLLCTMEKACGRIDGTLSPIARLAPGCLAGRAGNDIPGSHGGDRTSVGTGERVAVREERGGRRRSK